ncbi:MAG TPA: ABC transporter substrate-binding protein [Usitatibacter sp.]|nr:ABC transporter substrate-binding protein [Usitatibacter sp.]
MTLRVFAAALVAAMLAATPVQAAKIFRYASQVDPGTMDPHALASLYHTRVIGQIYEPIIGRDEGFRLQPRLALSWSMVDNGHAWRFKLRQGVKFHDGTPFTADDVVFTVERSLAKTSPQRATYPDVTGARKVDDYTVDILTSQPTPVLPRSLTNSRVVSKKWCIEHHVEKPLDYNAKEETYASRNANGTGPFMLKSWEPDVKTVLVANPNYWGQRGNVTEADYLVVAQAATRLAGLISGELDFVVDAGVQDIDRLRKTPGMTVSIAEGLGANYLGFDYSRDALLYGDAGGRNPFRDIRVRQAIRYALDLEAIRTKVMRNLASTGSAIFTPVVDGWDKRFGKIYPYDPDKARALLKEAGYPNGFSVVLDGSSQAPADAACQAVAGMLARVGIKVHFEPRTFNVLLPKVLTRDTSFYFIGWTPASADAEGVLLPLVHSASGPGVGEYNFGRYSNTKVDALIDSARVEMDEAKRRGMLTEAMTIMDADSGYIPILYRKTVWVMRANVKASAQPNDIVDLRFVNVQ